MALERAITSSRDGTWPLQPKLGTAPGPVIGQRGIVVAVDAIVGWPNTAAGCEKLVSGPTICRAQH